MSERSAIEWTDATWNPAVGCTKVSPGCAHCYAERVAERLQKAGSHRYRNGFKLTLHPDVLELPLRWKKPRRVFVNSMSDLFHEDIPDEFIDQVFAVMALAPQHIFQVLTKRAARMRAYMTLSEKNKVAGRVADATIERRRAAGHHDPVQPLWYMDPGSRWWPLRNAWMGVSVEDQRRAEERIPHLLATPAAVRFISAEPLLGPVDLTRLDYTESARKTLGDFAAWLGHDQVAAAASISPASHFIDSLRGRFEDGWHTGETNSRVGWVIAGGESGPGHRPMDVEWARRLRDQCVSAGVPFFMKQDSGSRAGQQGRLPDDLWRYKEMSRSVGEGEDDA